MRSTPKTWIVGTEGHLDHIQQTFGYLAFLNQMRCGSMRGHLDRSVVVGSTDDEIRFGHDAAFIRPVVMRQSPARRINDANSFRGSLSRLGVNVWRGDLRISHQFHPALRRV